MLRDPPRVFALSVYRESRREILELLLAARQAYAFAMKRKNQDAAAYAIAGINSLQMKAQQIRARYEATRY